MYREVLLTSGMGVVTNVHQLVHNSLDLEVVSYGISNQKDDAPDRIGESGFVAVVNKRIAVWILNCDPLRLKTQTAPNRL